MILFFIFRRKLCEKKTKIKKNVDSKIQSSSIRKEDYQYEYESKTIECRDEAG